jgi:alginate O-acetyltransferase complex protein AlgI
VIFAIPIAELEPGVAWLGIACYSLQIYFDFAGYSDMAIGLGRCFGFAFPENFDWPYTSRSLREFWRRWHMTLSTFFRDYLYIPLGGNRMGATRTAANLLIVFVLCGLWHGAAWVFVIWGLVHGFFLALERTRFGHELERAPAFVQHTYVVIVVMIAWVFFRADTLAHAVGYLAAMAGRQAEPGGAWPFVVVFDPLIASALAGAAFSAFPWVRRLSESSARLFEAPPLPLDVARLIALGLVGLLCAMSLAAGTHNPFIYFRF